MADHLKQLDSLRQQLISMGHAIELKHAVVLSPKPIGEDPQRLFRGLEHLGFKGNAALRISVSSKEEQTGVEHLFWDKQQTSLQAFIDVILDVNRLLPNLGEIVPKTYVPKMDDARHNKLVRWLSLLFHFAWSADRPWITARLHYSADDLSQFDAVVFAPYDSLQGPEVDPKPFVTMIEKRSYADATDEYRANGSEVPKYFVAYLIKNLLYESGYLIGHFIELASLSGGQPVAAKKPTRNRKIGKRVSMDAQALFHHLLDYHMSPEALREPKALEYEQMKKKFKFLWKQPHVSRLIGELFDPKAKEESRRCNGMQKYADAFVHDEPIKDFFTKCVEGRPELEPIWRDRRRFED